MFENLAVFEERYRELNERLCDPTVISDLKQYAAVRRELKGLEPIVEKYREYCDAQGSLRRSEALLQEGGIDRELRSLAEEQLAEAREASGRISEELKILLLPKDPMMTAMSLWKFEWRRRRGSSPVCGSPVSDVLHVCGNQKMEDRGAERERDGTGRI